MSFTPRQPAAELTLKKAEEGDSKIWVYNTHDEVLDLIEDNGEDVLVTFERVKGIGNPAVDFSTRPSNVVSVKDITV